MAGTRLPRETIMLFPPLISLIIIPQQTVYNYLLFFIFAAAHLASIMDVKHRTFLIIVQLVVIALQGAFFNPWELSLGFYPAMAIGMYPSYRQITRLTLFMAVLFGGAICFYFLWFANPLYLGWYSILLLLLWLPYMEGMRRKS